MGKARTHQKRPGNKKSSRPNSRTFPIAATDHAAILIDTVCYLAGDEHLIGDRDNPEIIRLRHAIEQNDTPYLFGQLIEAFSLQGISDHAAYTYMDRHGRVTWRDLEEATARPGPCSKLRCYWTFHDCGYQKGARTCAEPKILSACSVPRHKMRNGRLNRTAYALFLFIRDVAGNDLVSWIDHRLEHAYPGKSHDRLLRMRNALIEPLRNVFGVSDKVLNMTLSHVLMAAPPRKPLWLEVGASMIAIDTLVHNFLHRAGILRRFNAQHAYGPSCYEPNGCADIITQIATWIDARQTNSKYPATFPRFVQHAIWRYCAQLELDVCNGNRIDDRKRCANRGCPLFHLCDRVALQPLRP